MTIKLIRIVLLAQTALNYTHEGNKTISTAVCLLWFFDYISYAAPTFLIIIQSTSPYLVTVSE